MKALREDVFQRVTVVLVQFYPGMFFGVIDCKVCLGYKNTGERATRPNPAKLDAEDQEESVDMAGKVFL